MLYAAFNQQLELEQKEDSVTGSKGYKLVPKPTDELYDCRVKINLYFPDKIVNGRWYVTFSEESSVPEYFYPITALQQVHKAHTAEDKANYQAQLDNLLAYKEVQVGLDIMSFIQTILCLDNRVLDEVNEQFTADEYGSLEYRKVLYEKRKACRKDIISPYFEKIEHYCNTYFAQFLNEEYSGTKSFPDSKGLCKAVKYLVNNWKQITSFTDTPEMYCNNNRCEQTIKKALLTMKMRCQNFQTTKEALLF